MQIFLDTSDVESIQYVNGLLTDLCGEGNGLDGATTNPTSMRAYMESSRLPPTDIVRYIADITGKNVSVETLGSPAYIPGRLFASNTEQFAETVKRLYQEGCKIASLDPRLVAKVPATNAGYYAAWKLRQDDIPVNMTLVFSKAQGVHAGEVGATYVSPFVGRLEDRGEDGVGIAETIENELYRSRYTTMLLFASVRTPEHIMQAHKIGAHVVTIPPKEEILKLLRDDEHFRKFIWDARMHGRGRYPHDAVQLPNSPRRFSLQEMDTDAQRQLLLDGNRKFLEDAAAANYGYHMFGYPEVELQGTAPHDGMWPGNR